MKRRSSISALIHWISARLDRLSIFLARIVEGTLVAMMVLTGADVFLRMVFRRSIVGTLEIESNYFMVAIVFLPLAFGMIARQGHIRLDFVVSRFPLRVRRLLEMIGLILSICTYVLITWYGAAGGIHAWRTGDTMVNIPLPTWPGRALVAVGGGVLCLQMMVKVCQQLEALFKGTP
jgi:TRAP-type mannitol/chloroaromatic compound transport system permease small subunit